MTNLSPIRAAVPMGAVSFGAALSGAGAWAEIASGHDGAGTVAFVAAGTLLVGLGIIGRMPTRLRGKDWSAEWRDELLQATEARIEQEVDQLPKKTKEGIVHEASGQISVTAEASGSVSVVRAAEKSLQFERQIGERFRRVLLSERPESEIEDEDLFGDGQVDFVAKVGANQTILVEAGLHSYTGAQFQENVMKWFDVAPFLFDGKRVIVFSISPQRILYAQVYPEIVMGLINGPPSDEDFSKAISSVVYHWILATW